jgi:hypothetical protein
MPLSVASSRPVVAVALAAVPVLLMLGVAAMRPGGAATGAVRHGIGGGSVYLNEGGQLKVLATPFVIGTAYAGKLNVSEPPKPGYLNLYSVDPHRIGLPQLACNCAYVGDEIVACDRAFLGTFRSAINFQSQDPGLAKTLKQVDETFETWLGMWIVGHEVGHAVLHAKQIGIRPATASRGEAARLEREADRFFAERVPREQARRATFALNNFVFQIVSATYVTGPAGNDGRAVVRGDERQVHQPWVVRALDVARVVSETSAPVGSSNDFYDTLRQRIKVDAQGTDIGTFCDRGSLRARADAAMERRKAEGK